MEITEDKQRFIGVQDNHVPDVAEQSNESNWQDAVRTGAQAAKRNSAIQLKNLKRKIIKLNQKVG